MITLMTRSIILTFLWIGFLTLSGCAWLKERQKTKMKRLEPSLRKEIMEAQSMQIDMLEVGALLGLEPYGDSIHVNTVYIDSIVIDLDTLLRKNVEIDNRKRLRFKNIKMPEVQYRYSDEPLQKGLPYPVYELKFREIILRHKGEELRRFKYPAGYAPLNFTVEKSNKRKVMFEESERDSLILKIGDLELRIEQLRQKIKIILLIQPDHAAQALPVELDEIERDFNKIKDWYRDNRIPKSDVLRKHRRLVYSWEETIEDMEKEVDNPKEATIIEGSVLFKPGEFTIYDPQQKRPLSETILALENKRRLLQEDRPARNIKAYIRVTGYADDQEISDDLQKKLEKGAEKSPISKRQKGENKQDYLNRLLSQKRAQSICEYLLAHIRRDKNGPSLIIEPEWIGKGRTEYPAHIPANSCPGNCQGRRVVVISDVQFSED